MLLDDYISELLFLDDTDPVRPSTVSENTLPGKLGVMWEEVIPPLMATISRTFSHSPIIGYVGLTLSAALLVRPISHWTSVFFHWARLTENLQSEEYNLASQTEIESQQTEHCQFIYSNAYSDWTRELDEDTIQSVEDMVPISLTESPISEYMTVSEWDTQNNQVDSDMSDAADTTVQISFQEDLPKSISSGSRSSSKVPSVLCPTIMSKTEIKENPDPGTNIIVLKRSIFSKTSVQREKDCDTTKSEKRDSQTSITTSDNVHKSEVPSVKCTKSFTLSYNTEKPSKAPNIRFSSPVAHQIGEPEFKLCEVKGQHLKFHATGGMKLLRARAECKKCPLDGKCIIHRHQTFPLKPREKCQFQGKILPKKLRARNDIYKEKQRYIKSRSFPRSILQGYGKRYNDIKHMDANVKGGQVNTIWSPEEQQSGWNLRPGRSKMPGEQWFEMTDNMADNDSRYFCKTASKISTNEKKQTGDRQETLCPREILYGRKIHNSAREYSTKEQKYGRHIHHSPRGKPGGAQDTVSPNEQQYGTKIRHLHKYKRVDDVQDHLRAKDQQSCKKIHHLPKKGKDVVDDGQDSIFSSQQQCSKKIRHLPNMDDMHDSVFSSEQQYSRKKCHQPRDKHLDDMQYSGSPNEQQYGRIIHLSNKERLVDNEQDHASPTERCSRKKRHLCGDKYVDVTQEFVHANKQQEGRSLQANKHIDNVQDISSPKEQLCGRKIRHLPNKHMGDIQYIVSQKEQQYDKKIHHLPKNKYLKASSKELCNALSSDKLYASLVHHVWNHDINDFDAGNETVSQTGRYSQRRIPCLTKINKSQTSRIGYHQLWQWSHESTKSALEKSEVRHRWYANVGPPMYSAIVPFPGSKTNSSFVRSTHEGQHGSTKNVEKGCGEFCSQSYKLSNRDRKSLQSFLDEKEEKAKESRDKPLIIKAQNNKKDLIKKKSSKRSSSSLSFGCRKAKKHSDKASTSIPSIERGSPIKTAMKESKSSPNVGLCSPNKTTVKESKSNQSIWDTLSNKTTVQESKSSHSTGRCSRIKVTEKKSKLKSRVRRHISPIRNKVKSPKPCNRDGYSPQMKKAKKKSTCDVNRVTCKSTKGTIVSTAKGRRERICKMRSPAYKNRNVLFKSEKLVLSFTDLLEKSDESEKCVKRPDPGQTLLNISSDWQDLSSKEPWNHSLRAWSTGDKNAEHPKRILPHDSQHAKQDGKTFETKFIRKHKKAKPPCYPFANVKIERKGSPQTKYTIKSPSSNGNEITLKSSLFHEIPDYNLIEGTSTPNPTGKKTNISPPKEATVPLGQFMNEYCAQEGTKAAPLDNTPGQRLQSPKDNCRRSVYSSSSNNLSNSCSSLGSSPTYSVGVAVYSPTHAKKQRVYDNTIEKSVSDNPMNCKKLTKMNRMKKQQKQLPLGKVGDDSVDWGLKFVDASKDDKKEQVKSVSVKKDSPSSVLIQKSDSAQMQCEVENTGIMKKEVCGRRSKQKKVSSTRGFGSTIKVSSKNTPSDTTKEKTSVNGNTAKDLRTIIRKRKISKSSNQSVSYKTEASLLKQMESNLKDGLVSPKNSALSSCLSEGKKRVKKTTDTKESQKKTKKKPKSNAQILSDKVLSSLNALMKGTIASKNKMRPALATKKEPLLKSGDTKQRKARGDATSTSMATTKDGKSSDVKDSLKLLRAQREKNGGTRKTGKGIINRASKGIAKKERDIKTGDGAKKKKKPLQKPLVKNKTMKIQYGPVLLKTSSLESLALSVNDKRSTSNTKGLEEPSGTRFNTTRRKSNNRKETLSKSTTQQTQPTSNVNRSTQEKNKKSGMKKSMYTGVNSNLEDIPNNDPSYQRSITQSQSQLETSEMIDKNDCKKEYSKQVHQTRSVLFGHSSTIKSESVESLSFIIKEQYGLLFDSETLSQFLENEESSTFRFNDTTTHILTENETAEIPTLDHSTKNKTSEKTATKKGVPSKNANRAASLSKYGKSCRKLNYKSENHLKGKIKKIKLFDKYTKANQTESKLDIPGIDKKHRCEQQTADVRPSKSLYYNKTEPVEYSSVISRSERSESQSFTTKEQNGSVPLSSNKNEDTGYKDNDSTTNIPSNLQDESKVNNESHKLMKTEKNSPKPVGQNGLLTTENHLLRFPSDSIESLTFIVKERNGSQTNVDDTPNHFVDEESQTLEVSDPFPNNSIDSKMPRITTNLKEGRSQDLQNKPRLITEEYCDHEEGNSNTYWINEKLKEKSPSSQGFPVVKQLPETSDFLDSDQPSPQSWLNVERSNKKEQRDSRMHSFCTQDSRKKSLVRNDSPSKRKSRISSSASPVRSRKQIAKHEKVWTSEKFLNIRKNNESKKITSTERATSKRKRLTLPLKTNSRRHAVCRDTFVIEIHSEMQDSPELRHIKKSATTLSEHGELQPKFRPVEKDRVSTEQPTLENIREMGNMSPSQKMFGDWVLVVPKETPEFIKTINDNDDTIVDNLSTLNETFSGKNLQGLSGQALPEENNTFSFDQHTVTPELYSKSELACIPISEKKLCHNVGTCALVGNRLAGVSNNKKDRSVLKESLDSLRCEDADFHGQLNRKSSLQNKCELNCETIIDRSDFDSDKGIDVLSLLFQTSYPKQEKQMSPIFYTLVKPGQLDERTQNQSDTLENITLDTIPTCAVEVEAPEKPLTETKNKALPTAFVVNHPANTVLVNYTSSNAAQDPQTSPEYNLPGCHINQSTSKFPFHSPESGTGRTSTLLTWNEHKKSRIKSDDVDNDNNQKDSISIAQNNDKMGEKDTYTQSSLSNNEKVSYQSENKDDRAPQINIKDEACDGKDTSSVNGEQIVKTVDSASFSEVTENEKFSAEPETVNRCIENSLSMSCEKNVVRSQLVNGSMSQIEETGNLKEAANHSEEITERETNVKYKENSAQSRYEAILRAHYGGDHKVYIRDKGKYSKTIGKGKRNAAENTEGRESPHTRTEPNSVYLDDRQRGIQTRDEYDSMKTTDNDKTYGSRSNVGVVENSWPGRKYFKKGTKHTGIRMAAIKTKCKGTTGVAIGQQKIPSQDVVQTCQQQEQLKSHSIENGGLGRNIEFYKREAKPMGIAKLHSLFVANEGGVDSEENIKAINNAEKSLNISSCGTMCERDSSEKAPEIFEKIGAETENFQQDSKHVTRNKNRITGNGDSVSERFVQPESTLCLTNLQRMSEENAEMSKSTDKDLESLLMSEINIAAHSTGRHRIRHFFGKNASKKRKRTRSQEPLISRGEESQRSESNSVSMIQYQKSWSCIRQQSFLGDNDDKFDTLREMSSPPCKKSQFSRSTFNDTKQYFEKRCSKSTASWKGDARLSNIVESKSYWKRLSSNAVKAQSSHLENKDKIKVCETRKVPIDTKFESFLKRKEQKAPHSCNPIQHIKKTLESFSTEVVVSENKHETLEEFLKSSENGSSLHRDNQRGLEKQVPNVIEEGHDSKQSSSQKPFRRSGSQPIIPGGKNTKSRLSLTGNEDKPVRCRSAYTTRCSSNGGIHISEEYKNLSEKMSQLSKLISFDNDSDRTFTTIKSRIGSRSHDSKSTTKNRSFNSDEKSILAGAKDFVLKFSKSLESENKKKKIGNLRKASSSKESRKMCSSSSSKSAKSADTRTSRFQRQTIKSERTVINNVDNCSVASFPNINFSKSPKIDSPISPRKNECKIMEAPISSRQKAKISKSLPEDMNIQVTFPNTISPKTVRGYEKSNLKNVTRLIFQQDEVVKTKSSVSEASSDIDLSWADSTLESTLTWLTEKLGNNNANRHDFLSGQKDEEDQEGDISKYSMSEYLLDQDQPQDVDINSNMYSNYFEPVNGLPSFTKSYIGDDLTAFLIHNLDSFEKDTFHGAEKTIETRDLRQSGTENTIHTESVQYSMNGGLRPSTFPLFQTDVCADNRQNSQRTDKAGSSVLNFVKIKDKFVKSSNSDERKEISDASSSGNGPYSYQPSRIASRDGLDTCNNQKTSSNLLAWSQRYDQVHRHGQSAWFRLATSHRHCHSEADEKEIKRRYQTGRETQATYSSNAVLENHDADRPEEPEPSTSRDTREAESYTIRRTTERHEEAATGIEDGACCDSKSCDLDLDWYKPQAQPAASTSAHSMSAMLDRRTGGSHMGSHNTLGDFPRQRPRPTPRLSKRKNP